MFCGLAPFFGLSSYAFEHQPSKNGRKTAVEQNLQYQLPAS
jgi:hypothetical protein